MALTTEQKKFLGKLSADPISIKEELFQLSQERRTAYYNTFKNEYNIDGISLLQTLANGYVLNYEQYKELLLDVISHSNLDINDRKDSKKLSAYEIIMNSFRYYIKEDNTIYYDMIKTEEDKQKLDTILEKYYFLIKSANILHSHSYFKGVHFFLTNNLMDYYQGLIASPPPNINVHDIKKTLYAIVQKDDVNLFKQFIDKFELSEEKLVIHKFYKEKNNYNESEKNNLLSLAISEKKNNIVNYLIDNYPNLFKTNIKKVEASDNCSLAFYYDYNNSYSTFEYKNNVHPLLASILNNNYDAYEKIANNLNIVDFFHLLLNQYKQNGHVLFLHINSSITHTILSSVLNNKDNRYLNLVIQKTLSIKEHNDDNDFLNVSTLHVFKNLLSSSLKFSEIVQYVKDILPLLKTKLINNNDSYPSSLQNMANILWNNLFHRKSVTDEDINNILDIYDCLHQKQLHYFNPRSSLYTPNILRYTKLFTGLQERRIDFDNSVNDVTVHKSVGIALKTFIDLNAENKDNIYISEINSIKKSIKIIYDNTISSATKKAKLEKSQDLLAHCLTNKDKIVIECLNKEDIIYHEMISYEHKDKNNNVISNNVYYPLISSKTEYFQYVQNKLLSLDIDILENIFKDDRRFEKISIPLYLYINNDVDNNILDHLFSNISSKYPNKKIMLELSEDYNFWRSFNSDRVWQYFKDNGANFNNQSITNNLLNYASKNTFEKYIEYGGLAPEPNLIFNYIEREDYETCALLLKYAPESSYVINEQKKFPLSYLLSQFNTMLRRDKPNHSYYSYNPNKEKIDILYSIIDSQLDNPQIYKNTKENKKPLKELSAKIKKCDFITNKYPELVAKFAYNCMNYQLVNKEDKVKKHKL